MPWQRFKMAQEHTLHAFFGSLSRQDEQTKCPIEHCKE
jgi:hypothetical protein